MKVDATRHFESLANSIGRTISRRPIMLQVDYQDVIPFTLLPSWVEPSDVPRVGSICNRKFYFVTHYETGRPTEGDLGITLAMRGELVVGGDDLLDAHALVLRLVQRLAERGLAGQAEAQEAYDALERLRSLMVELSIGRD